MKGLLARSILTAIALSIFNLGIGWAGPAEDFKSALRALDRGDYSTALRLLEPLAEDGLSGAEWALGAIYYEGNGVPQDYAKALYWHQRAAEKGHPLSQFELGAMHDKGIGTRKDYAKAAKWFLRSAQQGYAKAQFNLGGMYASGDGVSKDYVSAYKWFSLAATGGTYMIKRVGAALKKEAARRSDKLVRRMTAGQLAKARQLVSEWQPKTEQNAIRNAQKVLGRQLSPQVKTATDFVLSTCYDVIDDISRLKSFARLMKWSALSEDAKNVIRPVQSENLEAWLVVEGGHRFMVSASEGQFRGRKSQICQVAFESPAEPVVAGIAAKVKVSKGQSIKMGLQTSQIYQLLEHSSVRTAFMIVSRGNDGGPLGLIAFMGLP